MPSRSSSTQAVSRTAEPCSTAVRFYDGDVELVGVLFTPADPGPHPGLILVHGFEPDDDRMYQDIGRRFAQRGTATLVFGKGKPCVGSSTTQQLSHKALVGEALAAARYLQTYANVDPQRVGLWGI